MRQYVIDQLSREERANLENYLKRTLKPSLIEGVFWIELGRDLLGEKQLGHETCGPFYLAVELGEESVCFELLVRSRSNLHCSCIAYATSAQRDFILDFIDRMLAEEHIKS